MDAVTVLTAYVLTLICIPSRLAVSGMGGVGAPAALVALACALWWCWDMLHRSEVLGVQHNPVRTALFLVLLAVAVSYWVAMTRPINPAEISTADLGLIGLIGWSGVFLLCHDGVPNLERLATLIRRLAAAGGALATLAILQFVTGQPLVNFITIPGLVSSQPLSSLSFRAGFNRPAATALHAIEFSVVVSMLLPIALASARWPDGRYWVRRWYPVTAMAVSIPIAISRSAVVCAVVALLVLIPTWPKLARRGAVAGGVALLLGVFFLIPGMLGSLLGLFTGISSDDSAGSRTGSYGMVWQYFLIHPVFGRGLFTFTPRYRILDNQYLGLLLDIGLVGLLAVLALFASAMITAAKVRTFSSDARTRDFAQSIAAAIAAGAAGFALFDGLGFPMAAGFLFLLLGLGGGLWRLVRISAPSFADVQTSAVEPRTFSPGQNQPPWDRD